jgi:hypothetical protein
MTRSGLSEAVDASSGAPEKRCLQTPRDYGAVSQEPPNHALSRGFAEERPTASKYEVGDDRKTTR